MVGIISKTKIHSLIVFFTFITFFTFAHSKDKLKVLISSDMEGIAGAVTSAEIHAGHPDYPYFRKIVMAETNAAVKAALKSGATSVVVKDAHGNAMNLIPSDLYEDERVTLIRNWSNTELMMMEGIDETFDAVIFIGYHATQGTQAATMEHSFTGGMSIHINGIKMSEGSINALMAGRHNVPVVFASGDQAFVTQIKSTLGNIETLAVKQAIGDAIHGIHPKIAQKKIFTGVKKALKNIKKYRPYKLNAPYTLKVAFKNTHLAHSAGQFPGVKRVGDYAVEYKDKSIYDIFNVLHFLVNLK